MTEVTPSKQPWYAGISGLVIHRSPEPTEAELIEEEAAEKSYYGPNGYSEDDPLNEINPHNEALALRELEGDDILAGEPDPEICYSCGRSPYSLRCLCNRRSRTSSHCGDGTLTAEEMEEILRPGTKKTT